MLSQDEAYAIAGTRTTVAGLFGDKADTWWRKLVIAAIAAKIQEVQSAAENSGGTGVSVYSNLLVLFATGLPSQILVLEGLVIHHALYYLLPVHLVEQRL